MARSSSLTSPDWQLGDLCKWRYRGKQRWQKSHVTRVLSDKDGSIGVLDKRTGFNAYIPNVPECIERRTS